MKTIENRGQNREAPVAQLDRASVFGTEGCRFESCRAYLRRKDLRRQSHRAVLNSVPNNDSPPAATDGEREAKPYGRLGFLKRLEVWYGTAQQDLVS